MNDNQVKKNLSALHNTLTSKGYDIPNIDQFTQDMRNEQNLREVYATLKKEGYTPPEFETFKDDMGWIRPKGAGVPIPLRPDDQVIKPTSPASITTEQPFGRDLPANPHLPSSAPKARLGFPRLDKKTLRPIQEVQDPNAPVLKATRDVAQDDNGNIVNVVRPELVPDFDAEHGGVTAQPAFLDVRSGKTIRVRDFSKEEIEGINRGDFDAVQDPKIRKALKESNFYYAPKLEEGDVRRTAKNLTDEIDQALRDRTEYLDRQAGEVTLADSPTAMGIRGFNMPAAYNKSRMEQSLDAEYRALDAARLTMRDVNGMIIEADHNSQSPEDFTKWYEQSALAGTLRGFGNTIIDPRLWDQGAREMSSSVALARAIDKSDRGEPLTRGEQLLLDAKANEMATALYFEDRIGRGYKAGSVTAHAVPFMIEMAIGGGLSTAGKSVSSGLARYAVRRFGAKLAGKALVKGAIRGASGMAGAAVGGALYTNTFGRMRTDADAIRRMTGDVKMGVALDEEGNVTTTYGGHTEGDSLGMAILKAQVAGTAEYATEMLGDGLVDMVKWAGGKLASPVVAKLSKLFGKAGAEAVETGVKVSTPWSLSRVGKLIDNIQASKFSASLKALEDQAQYNGVFGEYLEEVANNLVSVAIGDKNLSTEKGKGVFNLDDNIDTFLGVGLMGGLMSAARTAGYVAGGGLRGAARYQMGLAGDRVDGLLTTGDQFSRWRDLRNQITVRSGVEQVETIKEAMSDPAFNADQRRAILGYAKAVQEYRGARAFDEKAKEDPQQDPLQSQLGESFDMGAGITEAEEMHRTRGYYELTRELAKERLGVDDKALDELSQQEDISLEQVQALRQQYGTKTVQTYVDYLNARASYEGMIDNVRHSIASEVNAVEQAIRSRQHKDGTLQRATLRGEEGKEPSVYIKDGHLALTEEGKIDRDQSDKDFIVRDEETGEVRFVSIDDFLRSEAPTNADEEIEVQTSGLYQAKAEEVSAKINGELPMQVGDQFTVLDEEGQPQQITIAGVAEDGSLAVDYSGTPHQMTREELQAMADATHARQLASERADKELQDQQEERLEREEAGLARYALNDEITLRTPEGEEVRGYIQAEENAEGMIEVWTEKPVGGRKINVFSRDQLDGMVVATRLAPENTSVSDGKHQSFSEQTPMLPEASAEEQAEEDPRLGRPMTEEEADAFLDEISENPEVAPTLELTIENWDAEFGEYGLVETPLGIVHMGENQFVKLSREGRSGKLGMIRPTLERPDVIIKDTSQSEDEAERSHSYIFIKSVKQEGKERLYYFTSVSVSQDGQEVIVSNQEKRKNRVKTLLTGGEVLYLKPESLHPFTQVESSVSLNDSRTATQAENITAPHGIHSSEQASSEDKVSESPDEINPEDESLSPEEAYDAVLRVTEGDAEMAEEVIRQKIAGKKAKLTSAKKAKPRKAESVQAIAEALNEHKRKIEEAEASLAHWQAVASVPAQRAEAEAQAKIKELTPNAQPLNETEQASVPEWHNDNPEDARARGFIRIEGERIERQDELQDIVLGTEADVKFATNETQPARYALIEASQLQPSHRGGMQNPMHFIPEAQPKDRADYVSDQAAVRIASRISPQEITMGATAYTGAPTINPRGEVIQGNSRADALRLMWESYRGDSGVRYRQYLFDHAEELGLSAEAIEGMDSPVLVHLAEVDDTRAIELGQYRQSDIESGGVERISPQSLYGRLGDKRGNFAKVLLDTGDEDASLDTLLVRNGGQTLKWLLNQGQITETQYASAFDKGGSLTPEVKEDLKQTLYQSFFEGGYNGLPRDFETLPKRTQKALLSTAYRDQQSPKDGMFLDSLQEGVRAYRELMSYAPFEEARSFEEAEQALADWLRLGADLSTGQIPAEMFSNFALRLSLCYKFDSQRELSGKLKEVYDAVQNVAEDDLFNPEGQTQPKTLAEAIRDVFGIDYQPNNTEQDNGTDGSDAPSGHSEASQSGSPRGSGTPAGDEQGTSRAGQADSRGRVASDPQGGSVAETTPEAESTESPTTSLPNGEEAQTQDTAGTEEYVPKKMAGTFLDAIKLLYEKGKDVAGTVFQRSFFDVASTSDLLKEVGLTGDKFTIRYGVISRHFGKDKQHDLPLEIWERLPEALNNPLIVSKYYTSEGKQKGYRIYTSIQLEDGSHIAVGAEVKNAGRNVEVNSIETVFGRNQLAGSKEEIIYESNEMTPEQRTLLDGHNPHQYSDTQESLSEDKGKKKEVDILNQDTKNQGIPRPQKVDLIGLMEALNSNGEAKLSDHASELETESASLEAQAEEAQKAGIDSQGNPINSDGTLKVEEAVSYKPPVIEQVTETNNKEDHQVKEEDEREEITEAATESLASEAAALASEVSSIAEAEQTTEQEGALERILRRIDELLKQVDRKIDLLEKYQGEDSAKEFHESLGYLRDAERKAKRDATKLANRLVADLGLDPYEATHAPANKKGVRKKISPVSSSITPSGGDVTISLPLIDNYQLKLDILLDVPYESNSLSLDKAYLRIEDKAKGTSTSNQSFFETNTIRYGELDYHILLSQAKESIKELQRKLSQRENVPSSTEEATSNSTSTSNGTEEVHLRPSAGTREREGRHESRPNEALGTPAGDRTEQSQQGRVARRDAADTRADVLGGKGVSELSTEPRVKNKPKTENPATKASDAEASDAASPKQRNERNWREAAGVDRSPKGEIARVKANIEAIRKLKELEEEGREASREEQAILAKWTGWGGLGTAFAEGSSYRKELEQLLSSEELAEAQESRLSAYYTPGDIIDELWKVVEHLGFKGGNILEGSAGIGSMLARMPEGIRSKSQLQAVEKDGLTGGMLRQLYPDARVYIQGFEKTRIKPGSVDLAITNVPFVTGLSVHDDTGSSDLSRKFKDIHDFCLAKNVRSLAPGGIGVFLTSNGTLDSSTQFRNWLTDTRGGNADVIGAFRLNNRTFLGASVTSDILVIRKRVGSEGASAAAIDVSQIADVRTALQETRDYMGQVSLSKEQLMSYNAYYVAHPEHMGGEMKFAFEEGETYRATSKGLYPKPWINQSEVLSAWVGSFEGKNVAVSQVAPQALVKELDQASLNGRKIGELVVDEQGEIAIIDAGASEGSYYYSPLNLNKNKVKGKAKQEVLKDYNALKTAMDALIDYQAKHAEDTQLGALQEALNKAYDHFVNRYGHLNKNTAIAFLRHDISFPSVQALEGYEERGDAEGNKVKRYTKSDIFSKRVLSPVAATRPKEASQAVKSSILSFGRVDLDYLAEVLGKSEEEAKQEALSSGLAFENPSTGQLESRYEYLSGNVREKLREAEALNSEGQYRENIKALKEVQPQDIPAHLLPYSLGASWIPKELFEEYAYGLSKVKVSLSLHGGQWVLSPKSSIYTAENRDNGVYSSVKGETILATEIFDAAINFKTKRVSKSQSVGYGRNKTTETITDKEAMLAITDKADEMRLGFADWMQDKISQDSKLSDQLAQIYNEQMNNYAPLRLPDDFVPERFVGASQSVRLRPHQAKAAIRATAQPVLLAHEVGTGKTYTMISAAMEMRRLGTAKKPLVVVQNATVGQFAASAKTLYPQAKILSLGDSDKGANGRRRFYAQMMHNDWDMIIIPQSAFDRIPDSPEREAAYIRERINEKIRVLEAMKEDQSLDGSIEISRKEKELEALKAQETALAKGKLESQGFTKPSLDDKSRAKARSKTEAKAEAILDRSTDETYDFDTIGVDALLIDEAHEYKHLGFETAMERGIKGIDPSYSKKSQGLYLKVKSVLERSGGRNVLFATGTPISNTAAEVWTFMRYLMPAETLGDYGIGTFDDFVRSYGKVQSVLEFSTSGAFKPSMRFVGYDGLSELARIWSQVADTVLTSNSPEVQKRLPKVEGGGAQDIFLPQTLGLRAVMQHVKEELEAFDKMSGKEKRANSHIPLTMYGIAKAAAVDPRLVDEYAADDPNTKTNETVRQTLRSLEESEAYKGTVAIFCDIYQNKRSGFNLYKDIQSKLVEAGVPEDQIAVISGGLTQEKKLKIFDQVNNGEIRVVLGSTFTLGTGVNIQERLHTLIHIDAPNRPMDYTQRNGRIVRQGNLHVDMDKPVRILRFGVEDSLDVTAYQRLKTKGAIADSIMHSEELMEHALDNRSIEEEGDEFGDMVATLSGSEYALLKNQEEKKLRKLETKRKQWEADQRYIEQNLPSARAELQRTQAALASLKQDAGNAAQAFPAGDIRSLKIGKKDYSYPEAVAEFIKNYNKSIHEAEKALRDSPQEGNEQRSLMLEVNGEAVELKTDLTLKMETQGGSVTRRVSRKMTLWSKALGLQGEPVKQGLLANAISFLGGSIATGEYYTEQREALEGAQQSLAEHISQMEQREGQPFAEAAELREAQAKVREYEKLMAEELKAKEEKYKELDQQASQEHRIELSDVNEDEDELRYRGREEHAEDSLSEVNARFNEELQAQIDGMLPAGHVYQLGYPSEILRSAGIENLPIELTARRLAKKASTDYKSDHPFNLGDITNLPQAIAFPIAVFASHTQPGSKVILTELQDSRSVNFVVALRVAKSEDSQSLDVDVNDIRSLYPKDRIGGILDWMNQGSMLWVDREKALEWIDKRRSNSAEVADRSKSLSDATKVVETFDNPRTESEKTELAGVATETSEALGEGVRVIHDVSEIEGRNESETRQMRGAKGWYDPKTGEVVVVLPNAESAEDVQATILHEVVGHKGLQEVVGRDRFEGFLDHVFEGVSSGVRDGIIQRSKAYGWNTRLATEEYIAALAERGFQDLEARSVWHVIRNAFLGMLSRAKIALGWNINDRDLRYMLWRTYQMKQREGLVGLAKDVAMQSKLGVGNFGGKRFRDGVKRVAVARTYDGMVRKGSYQAQEALQDSMLSLKKTLEMIKAAQGDAKYIEEIDGFENPYLGENRVSSVNQAESVAYERMVLEPLVKEIARLSEGATREEVTEYMMAKHGLERNRVMAFQRAVEAQVEAHNKKAKEDGSKLISASDLWSDYLADEERIANETAYRSGKIDVATWHTKDNQLRAKYAPSYAKYRNRDYAGLTGLLDLEDISLQELETGAMELVQEFEGKHQTGRLWELTNKATDAPLQKQFDGGLMSRQTLNHVRSMYNYYIPLRGFDEMTSEDAYSYIGGRDRAFSPTLKKAKGRSSKAEDPIAHISSMMESAILQSNRNKLVRMKFLNFVENNPSDLFSVSDVWVEWNATDQTWDAVLPEFEPSDTSEEVVRKTREFEERMQKLQAERPDLYKRASEDTAIPYRVVGDQKKRQHVVLVKRGGRDVMVTVNGDPRVAMAVNGLTNPDSDAGGHEGAFFKKIGDVNRWLAGMYTSHNPEFTVTNLARDMIYANSVVWVKESPSYARAFHKNIARFNPVRLGKLVRLYNRGKLDMNNEDHRLFQMFMENGGETGYSQLRDIEKHKREIDRLVRESGGRLTVRQATDWLMKKLEDGNRAIENVSRVAAFVTSREMGRSLDRAIYDAKEITVNFNKKGAGSTFSDAHTQTGWGKAAAYTSGFGRSFYLFWNVAIQGTTNVAKAIKRNPAKGVAWMSTFLTLGAMIPFVASMAGGDDDRYWDLPEHTRRNNICFFVGDYLIKIPLPQEARAIYGLGEMGTSLYQGMEDTSDPWKLAGSIAGQVSQILPLDPIDDAGTLHALTPTIARPLEEVWTNRSWTGQAIWKDTDANKDMPGWTKAYKSTGSAYLWLAKTLSDLTGGDDFKAGFIDINPAAMEHLVKGYLGGPYTFFNKLVKTGETAVGEREFEMRNIPFLSRFMESYDERNAMRNVNGAYYRYKSEAREQERLERSYEGALDNGKPGDKDYQKKLEDLVSSKPYQRFLLFDEQSGEIEAMQSELKEVTDPLEAEELQAEIDRQKKALVQQLRQIK